MYSNAKNDLGMKRIDLVAVQNVADRQDENVFSIKENHCR